MSKLIMVGVLVGGLLAGAGSVMAQVPQGGIGDPLTLAASGVLIPYLTENGTLALVEVASPVGNNLNTHMQFFNATCAKVGPSVGIPLTTNDIAFQPVGLAQGGVVPAGTNGLVAISAIDQTGFGNLPLENPIHARIYLFAPADGTSRVIEPIILDTAEFPGDPHTWSPLRTAVTFFSPLQTSVVHTHLFLVCPRSTIQGAEGSYFDHALGFPAIEPPFPAGPGLLRARVYDTNEIFKRNILDIPCDCFSEKFLEDPAAIPGGEIFSNAAEVPFGTYTELEADPSLTTTFTGYRSIFTVNSSLNNFFGRLSNGSRPSIQGSLTPTR